MEDDVMRLPCKLTATEKGRRSDELARALEAHEALKAEQKEVAADFSQRLKTSEGRMYDLADVVGTGI